MFAALLLSIVPNQPIQCDSVDVIEVNHVYDDCGKHCFDQLIFWEWIPELKRYVVVDWRMNRASVYPRFDSGQWVILFFDYDSLRQIRAISTAETWTQHDPEIADRDFLPKHHRRKLSRLEPKQP